MKTRDFFFDLPAGLIAQEPPLVRGTSRLMAIDKARQTWQHLTIKDLPGLLPPGALLVLNDSRVRKARLFATREATGARVEVLFLEQLTPLSWRVKTNKQKRLKAGERLLFPDNRAGAIAACSDEERVLTFTEPLTGDFFERCGHMPLPPYIRREDKPADAERYQTVYAHTTGSAAAPTAGLHFTGELLGGLKEAGCKILYITLHVGLGTFLPIRTEDIEEHTMHEESFTIPAETAAALNSGLAQGRPLIAVGTTTVRTLESACHAGQIQAGSGKTNIYIYPGYRFKVVSGLLTNFHTPGSTLLLLVSAFAGQQLIAAAYQEAIAREYRFFSYGDAMLLL